MPRIIRTCLPGLPHHVIQRGNNRAATFFVPADYAKYLEFLRDAAATHGVAIHAYVLMTNHVHLLMTPNGEKDLSLLMQDLGRRFVRYINWSHNRSGSLWEGRFKSSVVDSDYYCLACYRYIELNPVRAGIVSSALDYDWSSCRYNATGASNSLLTIHDTYRQLGSTIEARTREYRRLISGDVDIECLESIRDAARKGSPLGGRLSRHS